MRSYSCYIYQLKGSNLERNDNTACFAGLNGIYRKAAKDVEANTIYIYDFRQKETEKYIDLLIKVINKITPCELVKIKSEEYIKFQLLPTYDQSLLLLNFIRNLWHSPKQYGTALKGSYSVEFFKELTISRRIDPFAKLTHANKKACSTVGFKGSAGHSNCHKGESLKLKKVKDLKAYMGGSTWAFLTT